MGNSIGFFCSNEDNFALQSFCESIGLILIAPTFDKELNQDAATGPYCFLSTVEKQELHPFGEPKIRLTDAKDPIMRFLRGYYSAPYLVAGHVYWSNDVPNLAARTKPYHQKISKWIAKNWAVLPGGGFYLGPGAQALVEKGAEIVNMLPNQATVSIIGV